MSAEIRCTYRLQLNERFGLDAAAGTVAYLAALGVSHVYLSPVLQAGTGSTHGYDVTDPARVSDAIGGRSALDRLFAKLREHGMGAVIDIVPNHLACLPENPWWWDVLRRGRESAHAAVFDIDWAPPDPELEGKVLLPVLGDHLGKVLADGALSVVQQENDPPLLAYYERRYPINGAGVEMLQKGETDVGRLLEVQFYKLANWRVGADEINYRRFFDISTLAGVWVEAPEVYPATHALLLEVAAAGPGDGLRVDHPDGLRDPAGYFRDLREAAGDRWIVVEKILEPGEALPADWPVEGTTGYDFLQRVGGLFIDSRGEKPISDFYSDFTGHSEPYGALVREKKRRVLELAFDGDLRRLVESFRAICEQPAVKLDYSRRVLRELLTEVLSSFPVYRTYVNPERGEITDADREAIRHALASTRRRDHPFDDELLELLEKVLHGEAPDGVQAEDFIARFQQLTGPVMAKGVEDTTFYCYDRLLALNEVGCDPARFGVSVQAFHEACSVAHREWPRGMLTTSTHDTKRSEDVRARISLLSEMGESWAEQVRLWSAHNAPAWAGREPDRNAEHLLYQTLVGAWPISTERIGEYMQKACREAKNYTSWIRPDEAYETRIRDFATTVTGDPEFVAMLEEFVTPLVTPGRINSLAQTVLKLTAPGIPDIYQGTEIWDNSLVDPDNRRSVDYRGRLELLRELEKSPDVAEIMARAEEGMPKLHVIRECLLLRKGCPAIFGPGPEGEYRPLLVSGGKLGHVVAFSRGGRLAVVVPRLVHTLGGDWQDTSVDLGEGEWRNPLDGSTRRGNVMLGELLFEFPVAVLTST